LNVTFSNLSTDTNFIAKIAIISRVTIPYTFSNTVWYFKESFSQDFVWPHMVSMERYWEVRAQCDSQIVVCSIWSWSVFTISHSWLQHQVTNKEKISFTTPLQKRPKKRLRHDLKGLYH